MGQSESEWPGQRLGAPTERARSADALAVQSLCLISALLGCLLEKGFTVMGVILGILSLTPYEAPDRLSKLRLRLWRGYKSEQVCGSRAGATHFVANRACTAVSGCLLLHRQQYCNGLKGGMGCLLNRSQPLYCKLLRKGYTCAHRHSMATEAVLARRSPVARLDRTLTLLIQPGSSRVLQASPRSLGKCVDKQGVASNKCQSALQRKHDTARKLWHTEAQNVQLISFKYFVSAACLKGISAVST